MTLLFIVSVGLCRAIDDLENSCIYTEAKFRREEVSEGGTYLPSKEELHWYIDSERYIPYPTVFDTLFKRMMCVKLVWVLGLSMASKQ